MREQLPVDEIFGVVDDHHHDRFGHQISRRLGHNAHVGIHQVADRFHLPLELGVHATSAGAVGTLETNNCAVNRVVLSW